MISDTDSRFDVAKFQAICDRAELLHAQLLHVTERHRDTRGRMTRIEQASRVNTRAYGKIQNPNTNTWVDCKDPSQVSLAELQAIEPDDWFAHRVFGFPEDGVELKRYISLRGEVARLDAVREQVQQKWHHVRMLQTRLEEFLRSKGVSLTDGIPVAPRGVVGADNGAPANTNSSFNSI